MDGMIKATVKRDGIVLAAALTVLTVLSMLKSDIPGYVSGIAFYAEMFSTFWFLVYTIVKLGPFALQVIMCVGAWRLVCGSPGGGNMLHFVFKLYRVVMYVCIVLICIVAAVLLFTTMGLRSVGGFIGMLLLFAVLIALCALFVYFYKQADLYVSDMKLRIMISDYKSAGVARSSLGTLLIILAVLNGLSFLSDVMGSGFTGMFSGMSVGSGIIGELADTILSALGGGSSVLVSTLHSLAGIFICIYGYIFTRDYAKLALLD